MKPNWVRSLGIQARVKCLNRRGTGEASAKEFRGWRRWPAALIALFVQFLAGIATAGAAALTVDLVAPEAAVVANGRLILRAEVRDASGLPGVYFCVDGVQVSPLLTSPPYAYILDTQRLPNGRRSLLAVAKDAGGASARSGIVHAWTTNQPTHALASPIPAIESLGNLLSVNTQERQVMYRDVSTGEHHLILYYLAPGGTQPFQMLDVNLTRGTTILVDCSYGRPGTYATAVHPNGRVYVASGDPGYLVEYNPATGLSRQIAPLHPTVRRDAQVACISPNGIVYFGEFNPVGGGAVGAYNPALDRFEDLGVMDAAFSGSQYSYTIGADERWVYVGLGQSPWYLAIHDTVSRTTQLHFKSNNDSEGAVVLGKEGGVYYRRTNGSSKKYYRLTNGVPVEISALPAVYDHWIESPNAAFDVGIFGSRYGLEINLDDAYPDSARNMATIRWRALGATLWNSATATGFRLGPANIKRLVSRDDRLLTGFADFYGPVFQYDTANRSVETKGRPQYSLYDIQISGRTAYFSGYPAATLSWDMDREWNLTATIADRTATSVNPRKLPIQTGKYHYYSAFADDGTLFIGAHHERDSSGGELGWYDPLTGEMGSLRTPFLTDDTRDLKPALGGSKIVYSGNNERLFVIDAKSRTVERTISPIPGIGPLDKVVEVEPGIIVGAVEDRLYRVDVLSGAILKLGTLPGKAFGGGAIAPYDRRMIVGPDRHIWLFADGSLVRVNPGTLAVSVITVTAPGNLVFHGGDLYLYSGPSLRVMRGLLHSVVPGAPDGLSSSGRP